MNFARCPITGEWNEADALPSWVRAGRPPATVSINYAGASALLFGKSVRLQTEVTCPVLLVHR